jgi:hypothetical protein
MEARNLKVKELMTFVPSGKDYKNEIRFYSDLGFTLHWTSDELSVLKIENFGFYLQNFENTEMQSNFMMDLEVEDLDAWWSKIQKMKISEKYQGASAKAPQDYPWGKREIHLITPARVLWHIAAPQAGNTSCNDAQGAPASIPGSTS